MSDLPKTLAASHWGHAYTLTEGEAGNGVTWGRLLLGEWMDKAEADALARQLAAAPELLSALQVTAGNVRSLGPAGALPEPYTVWLEVIEAAINKATTGAS